ncbi:MAG TPA: RluA family pseudouridine synthase [Clostridiales bacterium]|nr:RluA family pseudouridine synthase [Clostridiales bacterium]
MQRRLETIISPQEGGKTVKDILIHKLQLSSRLIKKCKRYNGGILLNGQPVYVTAQVCSGDRLSVLIESEEEGSDIIPVQGNLNIVYEDEDLLVLNKPAPMPTHPSRGHSDDSLANLVMGYYLSRSIRCVFRPVNRLDKDTSGLLLAAKSPHAHNLLNIQLHSRDFEREYLAVVCGSPPQQGTVDVPIARAENSIITRKADPFGKRAVTHYKTLLKGEDFSLMRLKLETGRTHQIRVHMAHIGHPLAGDFLYGKEDKRLITRTALHSWRIRFTHPITRQNLEFKAPLPEDMLNLIKKIHPKSKEG